MSIVVAKIHLSVLLKTTYHIMSLSVKCCAWNLLRLQCCYSSAVKGTIGVPWFPMMPKRDSWQRCIEVLIREKVAFLALDAKVVIAGFREPLTDMRKPRYLYSHTMIMDAPFCCEKQTEFVSIKFTWRLQYWTDCLQKSGVSQDIYSERRTR